MKSAVTISLVPQASGGPFVFWNGLEDGCARAAAHGFDAVEIFPASAADLNPTSLRKLLAGHGLRVAAVGTGAGWVVHKWSLTHADASVRVKAQAFVREIIAAAADLNAPAIIGSMQGRSEAGVSRALALQWFQEALEELGGFAASRGQILLCEPLNRYETNLLNNMAGAINFLAGLQSKNVKLLADLFHMNIEEHSIPEAIRQGGGCIGHVHFADSNRRPIGCGHTQIKPIIKALRATGYQGFLSAEALPWPDSETAARQTIDSFRRHISALC